MVVVPRSGVEGSGEKPGVSMDARVPSADSAGGRGESAAGRVTPASAVEESVDGEALVGRANSPAASRVHASAPARA